MRKLYVLAALASAVAFVAVPAGPATAFGGESLGRAINPSSSTTSQAGGCSTKGSLSPKLYYIMFGAMNGSGSYTYAWSFSEPVTVYSGCTSTSSSCEITAYGGGGTSLVAAPVRLADVREAWWPVDRGGSESVPAGKRSSPPCCCAVYAKAARARRHVEAGAGLRSRSATPTRCATPPKAATPPKPDPAVVCRLIGGVSYRVPPTGLEPVAYRLGGGRSIRLSYEGAVPRVPAATAPAVSRTRRRPPGFVASQDGARRKGAG
jgi:hypothetical protein